MTIQVTMGTTVIRSPQELETLINAALRLAAALWAQEMRRYVSEKRHISDGTRPKGAIPIAAGNLEREILSLIEAVKFDNLVMELQVGYESSEYQYVDRGRAAGSYPPLAAIDAWMRIKGMDPQKVWAVMTKLKQEGFPGYHFMSPLVTHGMRSMKWAVEQAFNQVNLDWFWEYVGYQAGIVVEGLT